MDIMLRLGMAALVLALFFGAIWLYQLWADGSGEGKGRSLGGNSSAGVASDASLVAAITAAVAVMMDTQPEKIVIQGIRQLDDGAAWRHYTLQRLFGQSRHWETRK